MEESPQANSPLEKNPKNGVASVATAISDQVNEWPDFSVSNLSDWRSSDRDEVNASDCCIVLSLVRGVTQDVPVHWTRIVHETGGIWQEQKQLLVLKLEPSESGLQIAHRIARRMAESNISARFAEFDQLIAYRRLLNEHGLDCNDHIQGLAEAYYPIDATEVALAIFGVTRLPVEAVDFIERGMVTLAILAPNCSDF